MSFIVSMRLSLVPRDGQICSTSSQGSDRQYAPVICQCIAAPSVLSCSSTLS